MKVFIKSFEVRSFKNLKDVRFDTNGKSVGITGENGIGKSNLLNAIYWCLTGADLEGSVDNSNFVPFHDKQQSVDVAVELNVATIRRRASYDVKGTLSQMLTIDGVDAPTLKDGEIEIDKRLGILEYTLESFSNKDFNLRQFLMNPNYYLTLSPKTIRDAVCRRLSKAYKGEIKFNPLFLSLVDKEVDTMPISDWYPIIENLYNKTAADKKKVDDELKIIDTVVSYIGDRSDLSFLDARKSELKEQKKSDEQALLIIENARQDLNVALESHGGDADTYSYVLHSVNSKGISKNDFSFQCYGFDIEQRSTSQSINDSIAMISDYSFGIGCDVELPLFVDRLESCDHNSIKKLFTNSRQVIATAVKNNEKELKLWQI